MEKVINDAYKIAVNGLNKCKGRHGYYGALNRFKNYWARDAFFAAFGAVYMNELELVKKELILFIRHQKKSGHIPRLVPKNIFYRFIFMSTEKIFDNPYLSPLLTYFSRDQNSLFVICAWEYIKKSKDYEFAKKYFDNFERAVNWNFKHDMDKDLLLEQGAYADWQDSIKKEAEVFFTNLCSYKAILCLSEIAKWIKIRVKEKQYTFLAKILKEQLNVHFWTGKFYADSIKLDEIAKDQKKPIFSGGSNMLAIYWGLADKKKSKKIFNYIKNHNLEHFSIEVNYPNYPDKKILFLFKLIGMKTYHTDMVWLWIGCVGALAYWKSGQKEKAMHLLRKISRKIVEYNQVYEVYEPSGEPVKKLLYKSAHPFAWSAGMFIYTYHKLKKNKK
jgi:glycogen debranching enzyme